MKINISILFPLFRHKRKFRKLWIFLMDTFCGLFQESARNRNIFANQYFFSKGQLYSILFFQGSMHFSSPQNKPYLIRLINNVCAFVLDVMSTD